MVAPKIQMNINLGRHYVGDHTQDFHKKKVLRLMVMINGMDEGIIKSVIFSFNYQLIFVIRIRIN